MSSDALPPEPLTATVTILTFNGEEYLDELLTACEHQRATFAYDVLVVDSGSTDRTLEIVAAHPSVRLHEIPNSAFGHGRTRNLAAELASGDVVVYLTHDAVPARDTWLEELVRPFGELPQLACVYGRQVPRPACNPTVKRDVLAFFGGLGPEPFLVVQRPPQSEDEQGRRDFLAFMSNVNSAVRRSVLQAIPFRDVSYAEDQALGADVLAAGWWKAYVPSAVVIHSHDYGLRRYYRRMVEEFSGLRAALGRQYAVSRRDLLSEAFRESVKDCVFAVRDPAYPPATTLKWVAVAPLYQLARRLAIWRAATAPFA